jgi:predicted metalloprotease with PDZ domain
LTDFRTRKIAEEKRPDLMPRPMEDMAIKPLSLKKRKREPYGIEQWLELLEPLMGDEVGELYKHMRSGSKIVLPEKFFGPKTHRIVTIQQEMSDFGMDRESFDVGVVRALKEGSRAEKAGFKEGDNIVRSSHLWKCVDAFEAQMEVVIERGGVEKAVNYWPRSIEKVDCLKFVKLEE